MQNSKSLFIAKRRKSSRSSNYRLIFPTFCLTEKRKTFVIWYRQISFSVGTVVQPALSDTCSTRVQKFANKKPTSSPSFFGWTRDSKEKVKMSCLYQRNREFSNFFIMLTRNTEIIFHKKNKEVKIYDREAFVVTRVENNLLACSTSDSRMGSRNIKFSFFENNATVQN